MLLPKRRFYYRRPYGCCESRQLVKRKNRFVYCTILNNEQFKYSYGRAFLMDRIKDTIIKLPVNENDNPDWNYMENYIKSLPYGDRLEG